MKDLLGYPIPLPDPALASHVPYNKDTPRGYAAKPGSGPAGETCRTCQHSCPIRHHDRNYWKCAHLRPNWTHGPGTDIRLKSPACTYWQQYTDFHAGDRVMIDGKRTGIVRGPSASPDYFEITLQYRRRRKHIHLSITRLRYIRSAR